MTLSGSVLKIKWHPAAKIVKKMNKNNHNIPHLHLNASVRPSLDWISHFIPNLQFT